MTAIVSPTARPTPKIIPAIIPDLAAGSSAKNTLRSLHAPSASEPSKYSDGTARSDVSLTETIVGRIIIARTIEAARMLVPLPPNTVRITGTIAVSPKKPYTTDGMPASRFTPCLITG